MRNANREASKRERALIGVINDLAIQVQWLRERLATLLPEPPATIPMDGYEEPVKNPEAWKPLKKHSALGSSIVDPEVKVPVVIEPPHPHLPSVMPVKQEEEANA
jgi:hypothetical protein